MSFLLFILPVRKGQNKGKRPPNVRRERARESPQPSFRNPPPPPPTHRVILDIGRRKRRSIKLLGFTKTLIRTRRVDQITLTEDKVVTTSTQFEEN